MFASRRDPLEIIENAVLAMQDLNKHARTIKANSLSIQGTVTRITLPTAWPGSGTCRESNRPVRSRLRESDETPGKRVVESATEVSTQPEGGTAR
jgi:hypothetical protein